MRPSLDNLADPDIRSLVGTALMLVGLAVLLLAISAAMRRGRVVAVLLALVLVVRQGPALGLLLVEAYPTTYRPSPTGFTAASIEFGRTVFAQTCVTCHGAAGDGTGRRETDLRQHHIWDHPVGDLFWFVSHGIPGPDGGLAMPGFAPALPEAARWSVIDYVYALNAGAVTRGLEGWPHRVPAPELALSCPGLPAHAIADLGGKAIRLILGSQTEPVAPLPPFNGIPVITIWLPETAAALPPGVDCEAQGGASAYAVLAGAADGRVSSARFLIDPEGVLRSVWRPGDGEEWSNRERLLDEVRAICTEALTTDLGDFHAH